MIAAPARRKRRRRLGQNIARIADMVRGGIFPCLFLTAISLGGASQANRFYDAALQIICLASLAWLALDRRLGVNLSGAGAASVAGLLAATIGVAGLQLVPLPPDIWTQLPGRDIVANGAALLGLPLAAAPLSLAPASGVESLLGFIPPITLFLWAAALGQNQGVGRLAWLAPAAALASVVLGLVQVFEGRNSPFHFYEVASRGAPAGLFANLNHQASFLLMTLPFYAVFARRYRARRAGYNADAGEGVVVGVLGLALVGGVLMAGSVAGYILAPLAVLGSWLVYRTGDSGARSGAGVVLGLSVGVAVLLVAVFTSPQLSGLGVTSFDGGHASRSDTFARTFSAISDHWAFGTGLGSYEAVYPLYEDPNEVTPIFINAAHNDYFQWALEFGLAGILLLIAAFAIWMVGGLKAWTSKTDRASAPLRRAASLSLLIVVLHSCVDYPLRTAACASFAALCLALLTLAPKTATSYKRPTGVRHLKL